MRVSVNGVSLWYDVLSPAVVADGERMVDRPVLVGVHGGPGIDSAGVAAHTELVVLPDCGHTVFRDQPEMAYATIRGFLADLDQ